jgi:hypothetical protein
MLSFLFWVAFASVFFGLKWLAEAWLALPEPKRRASASRIPTRVASHPSPSVTESLPRAA